MMRIAGYQAAMLLVVSAGWAQSTGPTTKPKAKPGDIQTSYASLTKSLQELTDRGAAESETRTRLRGFLLRFQTAHPRAPEILRTRCRLGSTLLRAFDAKAARREFNDVYSNANKSDLDLIGRALYGIAQSAELAGDTATALRFLRRTIEEARATRYARYAKVARVRLTDSNLPKVGAPSPRFGPRLDLDGKSRKSSALARSPALIVFCDGVDVDEKTELRRVLRAAEDAGIPNSQVVMFAMHPTKDALKRSANAEQWTIPILPCSGDFLDQDVLRFGVRELPATFLVGANGTLLGRDLTPRRLREVLGRR